ncbi:hypothetical protein CHU92_02040 [Flavobacterium cyanobacteriorum]|uniref:DUF4296 domain-containing protein n=1 Tax=Flavobacterium cyanobacteriorum TaxID=2022802 RepID=A0A255ZVE1_9FLAO|nr:DUF4296 domain-containing protein [Flavobacterium cyanobacteriorum]OYQ45359.1 hypothetical protein CHU92_02040 [Flavobacterium cyanobacteriorum]
MKKFIAIGLLLLFVSCRQGNAVEKPGKLIEREKMADILYDLSLLQAIRSQSPNTLRDENVDPQQYIYKKYAIDSITLAQNHKYYASKLEEYAKIQEEVKARVQARIKENEPKKDIKK